MYDWLGGIDALNRLTTRFYEHVAQDALLAPVFAHMGADHPAHVAAFLAEVLGGPADYSATHGGHPHMIRQHLDRHLTQDKRRRWVELLLATADELAMPDDPEFRSALVGYLEWGSRLARHQLAAGRDGRRARADAAMGLGRGQGALHRRLRPRGASVPGATLRAAR